MCSSLIVVAVIISLLCIVRSKDALQDKSDELLAQGKSLDDIMNMLE